jgi:hypothetical protein
MQFQYYFILPGIQVQSVWMCWRKITDSLMQYLARLLIAGPLRLRLGQGGAGAYKQVVMRLVNSVRVKRGVKFSARKSVIGLWV